MKKIYRCNSFTLIELLVAVSIFSVVAIALYSTFSAGVSVWRRSEEGLAIYQDVRILLDDMEKELKRAVLYGDESEEPMLAFEGASSEISFPTIANAATGDGTAYREIAKVSYRFSKEGAALMRVSSTVRQGFDDDSGTKETVRQGVAAFAVSYAYDSGDEDEPYVWKDEWKNDEGELPRGVRIMISLGDPVSGDVRAEFVKYVLIPTGVLGEREL